MNASWRPPSQSGRTIVVTGTGGLGLEAAVALAAAGAKLIIAGRSPDKGAAAVDRIMTSSPSACARFEQVDLASLRSIADLVRRIEDKEPVIDAVINNAGVMSPPNRRTTDDGFELQFGVNYLAHFALTARLLPLLRRSSAARVVNVTSLAHRHANIDFDDLQSQRRYRPGVAYCRSKLAQAIFAVELQRRSDAGGWGLTSLAGHPGFAGTDLFANGQGAASFMNWLSRAVIVPLIGQPAAEGALPLVYAAACADVSAATLYGPTGRFEMRGPPGPCGFAAAAEDPEVAARLWSVSEELVQIRFDAPRARTKRNQVSGIHTRAC